MITRQTILRTTVLAAATLALAGCASKAAAPAASSTMQVYTATLSPGEEVPPAAESRGSGTAEVRVNTRTNEITWKVTVTGLTGPATMGHIHGPAARGANAGIAVNLAGVTGATNAEGKGTLTPTQYGDMAAGLHYVNIHTAKYPGGEVRGQLVRRP